MNQAILTTGVIVLAAGSQAATLTQWNFNSAVPDANTATGTTNPSIGSGTASLVGGVTGTFSSGDAGTGSSDPATGDDSGWQTTGYSAQGTGSLSSGVQFKVSTLGQINVKVGWDLRHSNTSSRYEQFQYTTNGTTWTSFGSALDGNTGDTWFNGRLVDLTGVGGVSNNANFGFRVVAAFAPGSGNYAASSPTGTYAGTGTWRFDMVTVSATAVPEPATMAILGVGAAALIRRRKASK